jgi:hypothetical protein
MIGVFSFFTLLAVCGGRMLPIPEDATPNELEVIHAIPIPHGDEPILRYDYNNITNAIESHQKETLRSLYLFAVPIYKFAESKNYTDLEVYREFVLDESSTYNHFEGKLFAQLMCILYRLLPKDQLIKLVGSPTEAMHQPFAALLQNLMGQEVPLVVGGQRDGLIKVMDYDEERRPSSALTVAYLSCIFKKIELVESRKAFMRNSKSEQQKLVKFSNNLGSGYPLSVYDSWDLYPSNVSSVQNNYYESGMSVLAGEFYSVQVGGLEDLGMDHDRSKQIILNHRVSRQKVYPGYFASKGEVSIKHASTHCEDDLLVVRSTLSNGTAKIADRVVVIRTSSQTILAVYKSYDQVVQYASASLQSRDLQPKSNVTVLYTGKVESVEEVEYFLGQDSSNCTTIRVRVPDSDVEKVGRSMGKKDEYLTKFSFTDEQGKWNAQWDDEAETFVVV